MDAPHCHHLSTGEYTLWRRDALEALGPAHAAQLYRETEMHQAMRGCWGVVGRVGHISACRGAVTSAHVAARSHQRMSRLGHISA